MALLKRGDHGPAVGHVQQRLIEAGYVVDRAELWGPATFGESTLRAVRSYQAAHAGPDGHALSEDGIVGPATAWALDHPGPLPRGRFTSPGWRCNPSEVDPQVRPAIEAAVLDLVRPTFEEPDGSNSGPRLAKYCNGDLPWCAYALSYWFQQLPMGSPFGVIASAYKLAAWGERFGRTLAADQSLESGDVFVILRAPDDNGERHGHVGLIVGVDGLAALTIEGNCSNAVRGMRRARSSFSCVIRPLLTLS